MRFAEEIAVLDGLDLSPGTLPHKFNVIDPSGGALYTGGSDFSPGFPLLPSSSGLASADSDLRNKSKMLTRKNVIDPSGGANYTGGSDFPGGFPLLPSSAGLAGMALADIDLTTKAQTLKPRVNVVDPNGGQYTGGNAYSPFVPMLPSSSGLAGLARLDQTPDVTFMKGMTPKLKAAFSTVASKDALTKLQTMLANLKASYMGLTPAQQYVARKKIQELASTLVRVRGLRAKILTDKASTARKGPYGI